MALATDLTHISQQVFDTAAERVASGKAAALERHKAQVALGASKLLLERARQGAEALRKKLAATWGATQPRFTQAEGAFEVVPAIPTADQLAALISQNPDIARWKTEMEQRQAALAVARAKAIPDVTLRGGIKHLEDTDDTGFLIGFSIPLPAFDRNQGGIRESMAKLAKATQERPRRRGQGSQQPCHRLPDDGLPHSPKRRSSRTIFSPRPSRRLMPPTKAIGRANSSTWTSWMPSARCTKHAASTSMPWPNITRQSPMWNG